MAVTGKTRRQAEQSRISQIGDFKKRMGGELELPSGLIVKWKNPGGMRAFLNKDHKGVIPNGLMTIIQRSIDKGKGVDVTKELLNSEGGIDPEMFDEMMQMLDGVAMTCIVEPKIWPRLTQADVDKWNADPENDEVDDPEDLRRDDRLYVDELPDDDKQFLFQLVSGGTRDLEQFRSQHDASVASVADESGRRAGTKRDVGTDAG